MTTQGEYFTDGIEKCPKCGSANVAVEFISYYFIKRDYDMDYSYHITDEWEGDETDERLTCMECDHIL